MLVYGFLFFGSIASSLLVVFRDGVLSRVLSFFVFFLLFFIAAFRYETGYDWLVYEQFYTSLLQGEVFRISFEPGFQLVAKFLVSLEQNYYVLQVLFSIFACFSIYRLASVWGGAGLSVFPLLYLATNFFTSQMGTIRYTAAVSIFCLGFRWVVAGSAIKYMVFVFLALMFHSAAVFFFVFYFLCRWGGARGYYLFLIGVSGIFLFIGRDVVLGLFPFVVGDGDLVVENLSGKFFRSFVYVVIFLVCHFKRDELISIDVSLYNSALFSMVLFFLFSWSSVLASRLVEPLMLVSFIGFYFAIRCYSLVDRFFIISCLVVYLLVKMGVIFSGGDMVVFVPYQSLFFDFGGGDGMERAYQLYNSKFK